MTETPFKAFQADVKFDAGAGGGEALIASAEENQNKYLESLHKRNAALFKYELEHAKVADNRWDKLAEFSQTAASIAAPMLQARTNKELEKGAKLYKDGLANNQADRQAEYERDEQQQLTEELVNNEIIDDAEKKGEIDPWLKDKLKKIPRLQKIGYQKALYAQEAKMYPLYREQNKSVPVEIEDSNGQVVERALEDAKDPNEWHQINQRLINGYIRPFATHEQPMVEKYLYKEMRSIEDIEEKKWTTSRLEQITADDNLKADNSLKNNFASDPGSVMKYALTEQSRYGSISKAHDAAQKLVEGEINLGLANNDDIIALGNSVYIDKTTGKEYLYKDRFPRRMIAYQNAIHERDKKDHQKKVDQETIAFKNDEDKVRDTFNKKWDDGEEVKTDEVEKEQDRFVKTYGKRSSKLDAIKQDLTIEAKTLDKFTKEAEAYADLGLLTKDKLAEFPWQIQRKFNDVAQLQTTANTGGKLYIDAIADLLKVNSTTLPDGTRDPSVRIMTSRMQKLYRKTLLDALENDVESPYEYAYSKVDTYIKNKVLTNKTNRGYKLDLPKADQLTTSSIQINQRRQETNSWISRGTQSLDEQDTFFSAVEISNALKGYGKPGWSPHPRAVYIASQYDGIDPLAVLQKQAKAYDPKADMQDPPSIKAFNEKVDKYSKQFILDPRNWSNYDGVVRAWSTTGEVNRSIFMNAEQSKQFGDELGLPDYAIEAAAELGFLEREEPLDEEEERLYFKAIYKLSGGTDTRALQRLTRPKFKP